MSETNNQDIFDNLLFMVLTTVSCEEYLSHYNIYRPSSIKNWKMFKYAVDKQILKPGIYPKSYGGDTAHYYGVRKEKNGDITVANGYPSNGDLNPMYAKGLNAQEDNSHGLCQVYALMYYFHKEYLLVCSKNNCRNIYYTNILIGLTWLQTFIKSHNWIFNQKDMFSFLETLDYNKINMFKNKKNIYLYDIITYILSEDNNKSLKKWFYE